MIFKMWKKSKFVLWQLRYNLLTEKRVRIYFFEALIILKTYCQSQEILFKHHLQTIFLREILHGLFWNSIILVEGKREVFKYFWLNTMQVILEVKILLVRNKNIYISVTHPILYGSVHTGCCTYKAVVYICIIYLHVKEACLKVTIVMSCTFEKPIKCYEYYIFNSIPIYSWKKVSQQI